MATQETWIARPGELIRPADLVEDLATRVGGLPLYPTACSPPPADTTACGVCGKQLALLLQAHAPLDADQVGVAQPRRFLYLFGCVAEGCGQQPSCWRALRVVVSAAADNEGSKAAAHAASPADAPASTSAAPTPQAVPAPAPEPEPAADDWGVGGGDDWGVGASDDWGAEAGDASTAASSSAFDFGDLNAALEAVGSTAAAPKAAAKQAAAQPGQPTEAAAAAGRPVYDPTHPSLPAFYLYAQPASQCGGSKSSGVSRAEQEHLQQLMARYEEEAAAAGEAAAASGGAGGGGGASSSGAGAGAGVVACSPSIEGGPESWGGETYEEDAVLAPAGGKRVGAAYFKFSKQLGKCPDQCARYSFGGSPLWPSEKQPAAPEPCSSCGAPRVFELQLMTPSIPALTESAEWLAAEGGEGAAALLQPADSWEWLTVCVYCCSQSCESGGEGAGGSGASIHTEEVTLAIEDQ